MNNAIHSFMAENRRTTKLVLAILSAVSAYFTYQGAVFVLDQDSVQAGVNLSALIFSSGVSAALFLFWNYALGIVPNMKTGRTRTLGMSIIGLGCLFIVCLSSWMNVMALAGSGALEAHMRGSMKRFETALTNAYAQAIKVGGLLSDLDLAAKRYSDLAVSEVRRGTLTGAAGAGGVSDSLEATGNTFSDLAAAIRTELKRFDGLHKEGQAALAGMDAAVTGKGAIEDRRTVYAAQAAQVTRLVGELGSGELTSVIARTMRGLNGNAGLFSTSLKNDRLAKAQQDALQRIADDIAATGERIATAADTLGQTTRIEVAAFERMGLAKAVVIYAGELLPYWAGGIGLDLMPVVLILLLMLFAYAADGRNTTDAEVDAMPFGQVRKVIYAIKEMEGCAKIDDNTQHAPKLLEGRVETKAHAPATPAANQTEGTGPLSNDEDAEWERHIKA